MLEGLVYILMEKWWPWLIILSLKNGSDTFNASMCLKLPDRLVIAGRNHMWNPLVSLSKRNASFSVRTVNWVKLQHGWPIQQVATPLGTCDKGVQSLKMYILMQYTVITNKKNQTFELSTFIQSEKLVVLSLTVLVDHASIYRDVSYQVGGSRLEWKCKCAGTKK